jgi:hypothetical protein
MYRNMGTLVKVHMYTHKYLDLHTWESLYYGVSPYSNMYLRKSRDLDDAKSSKDPKGTGSDLHCPQYSVD